MYSNCDNSNDDRCTNVGSLSPHVHIHTYSIRCTFFSGCQFCSPGFQYFPSPPPTCALWYWNIVFGHWFKINGLRGASQEHPKSGSFFPQHALKVVANICPSATMFKIRNASVWWQTFKAGFPKLMFDINVLNEGHLSVILVWRRNDLTNGTITISENKWRR